MTLIAAISMEKGLEGTFFTQETVDWTFFCNIVPRILDNGDDCILFGNNASWHTSKAT
jgi:hypothetical protein